MRYCDLDGSKRLAINNALGCTPHYAENGGIVVPVKPGEYTKTLGILAANGMRDTGLYKYSTQPQGVDDPTVYQHKDGYFMYVSAMLV